MSTDVQVWNPEKISLIQRVIAPSVSKDEFDMFIARCKQTGLDPIARQIYAISRYDRQVGGNKMSIQVSIDGMRLLAERSGKYAGQLGPLFCGKDGKEWYEVWTSSEPPYAAKVGILRSDFQQPLWSVAKYGEYVQTNKDGHPLSLWAKMPDLMLAKCAESLALRRAFPYETSGLYTREEMGQADNEVVISEVIEAGQADVPATDQQLASIRKLCEHLGHELQDEEIAHMTYQQAKARIEELNTESRDARDRHEQERARKPAQPLHNGDESPVTILRVKDVYGRGVERGAWTEKDFYATISAALGGKPVSRENAHQLTQKELAVLNTLPPVTAAV